MAHKLLQRGEELVVQDNRHRDQSYSNRVKGPRSDQIDKAPPDRPSLRVPIYDLVERHNHPINYKSQNHASNGHILIVLYLLKHSIYSGLPSNLSQRRRLAIIYRLKIIRVLVFETKVGGP